MSKLLIDTGPSRRGWHRLEAHLRCPQLYAWGYGQAGSANPEVALASRLRFPPGPPLVRGSIGHAGLAHLYARLQAVQERSDPDQFYLPTEAMRLVAHSFPTDSFAKLGKEMLPIAERVVRAYAEHFSHEKWKIVAVEHEEETHFGQFLYTARVDLEYEDRAGKIWFLDHKLVNRVEAKVLQRYTLSGQILGLLHLGSRKYGERFGGVQLNLLGVNPIAFIRHIPDPAPWLLERFPEVVKLAEEAISRTDELVRQNLTVPAAPSEFTCWNSYGRCPAFELCRWGADSSRDISATFG
jgi:hypothetical protein